ncbi:EamA family transporter [Ancylobacter sp. WKF20]|uniref:DMT family transporter n=1 Tax=Ancylobacter sp. WKF20 TaxID=3039801 RepID=UPI00243424F4|nr:EamA family transporter [Ancylobacter sp. WKF20]WGD30498.1 EamA family transporter [Ancylobacter sp. WKF20]
MSSSAAGTAAATPAGTPVAARPPLSAYGHLLAIYIVWGGAYFAVKICVSGPALVTVFQLQSVRMWGASLLLALVALIRCGPPRRLRPADLLICAASGSLMWVAGNGLATLASKHATSSFIVMAMGAIPLWSCLLELLIARQVPSLRVVTGLCLGLFGLFLVVSPTLVDAHSAIIEPGYGRLVVAILIAAGVSWSLGTIVQRPLMQRMATEWAATFQMLTAALVLTLFTGVESAPLPQSPSLPQWLALGFLIVFASVIGLTSYIRVLRAFTPTVATTFAYVNPIIGVLLGWIILGETLATVSLAGLAVVLASIAIVLSGRR